VQRAGRGTAAHAVVSSTIGRRFPRRNIDENG
jgi:hypothetical protein